MNRRIRIITVALSLLAIRASAQTNIFPPTGNVGIGTTTPSFPLDVVGTIRASADVIAGNNGITRSIVPLAMLGGDEIVNSTSWEVITRTSYTSIAGLFAGTPVLPGTTRKYYLIIRRADNQSGGIGSYWRFSCSADWNGGNNIPGHGFSLVSNWGWVSEGTTDWVEIPPGAINPSCSVPYWELDAKMPYSGVTMRVMSVSMAAVDVYNGSNIGYSAAASGNAVYPQLNWFADNISVSGTSGNVGIGTTTPGAKLEVNGAIKLTQGSGGAIIFSDGTTQSTAYSGVVCGGDYAESIDVTGDRKHYQPGDVLVIDPDAPGKFLKSAEPYSMAVAGIYSTKPGYVGRRQTTPKSPDEVPMAMVGIVPTKVSAENGPIHPGDVLVTASKLGYAMKGTDRSRLIGAVVGKALGKLDSGTGTIEVLVSLQ